jgi:predicted MPP superfamily phosphohydrolase
MKPIIVLDHAPFRYKALWAAGADLVLSGHTHGGQSFPGNLVYKLTPLFGYGRRNRIKPGTP